MKPGKITRIVKMLTVLQSGKHYTIEDFSEIFGTSRRTSFRDLQELRAIGVPFHYDSETAGYMVDPDFFLPPVDLSLQEALSLLMAAYMADKQMQLPFKHSALMAALKIENNLPAHIRQYCNAALKNISTKAAAQAKLGGFDSIFAQLQKSIITRHKVNICYDSLYDGKVIDTELCPYRLRFNYRAWYVVGLSGLHKEVRMFKLDRIKELKMLDKCFPDDEKFDLDDYFGRAWAMIPEGRIYNIKLKFLPKVATNVSEVHWHSTQRVTHNDDGSAIVEFRVDGLGEISWWILGYGDQVEVLAPNALRKRIVETAQNMVKLNEEI